MASERELELLRVIADHRLLTVSQLEQLHYSSRQAANRALRRMVEAGWVIRSQLNCEGKRGRPETVVSLTAAAVGLLRDAGVLPADLPADRATAAALVRMMEHEVLLNWFRVQLLAVEGENAAFSTRFLSVNSPFSLDDEQKSLLTDSVPVAPNEAERRGLRPDGAFCLTHKDSGKSLLFFLEVDRGTEALSSQQDKASTVAEKLNDYRVYLGTEGYKRYQGVFQTHFHGFRVLFLANSGDRQVKISRLITKLRPSDFAWVTDQEQMTTKGLAAPIWRRGGQLDRAPESILGKTNTQTGDTREGQPE